MMVRISPLLLRLAAAVSIDRDTLLEAAGVSPGAMTRPSGLRDEEGVRLWEALARLSGDPLVGLTAGERIRLDTLGMSGLAFVTARDLADSLRVVDRTLPLILGWREFRVGHDAEGGGIEYTMPELITRHGVDMLFAGVLTLARRCTGHPIRPRAVAFQMPAPADPARYVQVFGVEPTFGAERCRLWFEAEDLARPCVGADPATSDLLREHADSLLGEPPPSEKITRVEAAFLRSLDRGDGSLEGTAALLGVRPRTLQRRLHQEETTFKKLRDRVLQREAERSLARGDSVDQVTSRLGYASRSSFERAFLRWTGVTPGYFRSGPRES